MSAKRHSVALCAMLVLISGALLAQMTITGNIAGTVIDPSGQVVAGAKVTLTSDKTGDVRTATTNEMGAFNLAAVQPDTYTLKVEQGGFKSFQRTGLVVSANEHVAVGDIQLQIGAVSETITVEAKGAMVQTDSAENSAVL